MKEKLTIRRIHEALAFNQINQLDDTEFIDEEKFFKKIIPLESYDIEIRSGLALGTFIAVKKTRYKALEKLEPQFVRVVFEPNAKEKYDKEVYWMVEGCWVDMVEKLVMETEQKRASLANKIHQEIRIPSIL